MNNAATAWTAMLNRQLLAQWLERQGLGQGDVEDIEPLAGGTQNILLAFTFRDRRLVLRRPSADPLPKANETMRREATMLAALNGSQVPHPRLVAGCSDEAVMGCAFYVMEAVDGFNPTQEMPQYHHDAAVQHEMGMALVDGIVALGAIDPDSVGLSSLGKPDKFLARQVSRWARQLDSYSQFPDWQGPSGLPDIALIGEWLDRNRPDDAGPGILHGDYHLANVMFSRTSPDLAAIIDWELTTVGDPLLDLGWLLATWPGDDIPIPTTLDIQPWCGFPSEEQLVERYAKGSDRNLGYIDWYKVLACYKLAIILEGTNARASAGKADPATARTLHSGAIGLLRRAGDIIA